MALLWDAVATQNARLLERGIRNLPDKLDRATWLNYVRCHDDIGLGFDDRDIVEAGYDPRAHRRFLVDYFTGAWNDSPARGQPFGHNAKTGDARISGSLASLAGLESAIESGDEHAIQQRVDLILLLHGMIMSFGGIPLLYYGDEIGMLNDFSFMQDEEKAQDTRWIHRPFIDWDKAERRHRQGTVEHLFVFIRSDPFELNDQVLVVGNFDDAPQSLTLSDLGNRALFGYGRLRDLYSGEAPNLFNDQLVIPPYRFYWLSTR